VIVCRPEDEATTGLANGFHRVDAERRRLDRDGALAKNAPTTFDTVISAPGDPAAILCPRRARPGARRAILSHRNLASNALILVEGGVSPRRRSTCTRCRLSRTAFVAINCVLLSGCPDALAIEVRCRHRGRPLPRATVMMGIPRSTRDC
jgi:malonyl-CoA/methylmalonyl-CoA synthetase